MEIIHHGVDFFIHLDHHIAALSQQWGAWTYLILFLIIFCETGLVVTPFLPGDSLLFVMGALSATGDFSLVLLLVLLSLAAVGGNMLNYSIGTFLSAKVIHNHSIPFVNPSHIKRTHEFFEKYGAKTIIITRFVPIIRTFAPFMAGVGNMPYGKFTLYNIMGGTAWVLVGVLSGFFFGNMPWVKKNFSLVILCIVVLSLIPAVIEYLRHRRKS